MTLEVRYDAQRNHLTIAVPDRRPVRALSDLPGWRRAPSGSYWAPAWPSAVLALASSKVPLRWDETAAMRRDQAQEELQRVHQHLHGATPLPMKLQTERRPKEHQIRGLLAIRSMGCRAILADDMGLGKTSTALWALSFLQRLLVICPVSVKYNWRNEIHATLGEQWHVTVINGGSKKRADQFAEAFAASHAGKTAIVINYDLLRHLSEGQLTELRLFPEGVLVDESHYIKGRNSDRTRLVMHLASAAHAVIAMTGTPIRNLADDLFTQVELVRPGTWTSFRDFAQRHLVMQAIKFGKRTQTTVVGTKNLDALNAVMNTLQIKRSKGAVGGLPPKVHTYPELQLEGPLLKVYKAMREFAKLELSKLVNHGDDHTIATGLGHVTIFDPRAKSAVEQAMRCEQIAQGFIGGIPDPVMLQLGDSLQHAEKIPGRPNELIFPSATKLVWIMEAIESVLRQGGAPLVFSRFHAPMLWLRDRLKTLGISSLVLHGGLSPEDKEGAVRAFQEKAADVLISQVKIAEGWNATRSQDVLFLGRDWSPAINAQAEDRAHRIGQKGTVNVQIPIVRNTIELMVHRRLQAKDADAAQALRNVTIEELMEAL